MRFRQAMITAISHTAFGTIEVGKRQLLSAAAAVLLDFFDDGHLGLHR